MVAAQSYNSQGAKPTCFYARRKGGGVAGVLLASYKPGRRQVKVEHMYVRPEDRGAGAGKALLGQVVEAAKRDDRYDEIHTEVARTNSRARNMVEGLGFESAGQNLTARSYKLVLTKQR
ncbi:MAG: GNAT family N-acetyltransferase [Candidatus Altiarchaeota archaeon]